jgi:hypothetical protein
MLGTYISGSVRLGARNIETQITSKGVDTKLSTSTATSITEAVRFE